MPIFSTTKETECPKCRELNRRDVPMKKGEKAVIAVAVSGIVVAAIAMAVSGSKAKAAGGGGNNGGISIILYDQNGNIIGSAAELAVPGAYGAVVSSATEGDTISMVIGATNTSYQEIGGVNTPIAAALTSLAGVLSSSLFL